jgi:RHS repeat-associated protein
VETFVYDAVGNRIEAADANGTTTYAYDARDRLVHESRPDGSELHYDYDAAGNRTKVTAIANGTTRVTRYVYDAAGHNTQVIDHDGRVTRQVFDAVGNLVRIELPNGLVTTQEYDGRDRLIRITTRANNGDLVTDIRYTLDSTGKRVRIDEQDAAGSRATQYTYDAAGRLTSETRTDPLNGNRSASYVYDKVGNRTSETVNGIGKAYSYDANDRLLAAGATSFGYDAICNLVLRQDASGTAAYGWDAKRRMTSASVAGKSISYRYNVDDIRTRKVVNGSATDYLVDHNTAYPQVLAELGAANDAWYTLGDSRRISRHAANDASYYLADAQGTTKALADATGDITSRYAYSAFGEPLNQTGTAQNDFRYTGEQYDEDLGQYYLRARYYDPATGRFTRMDTWPGEDEYPVTLNKYLYANADPVLYADPSGMWYTISSVTVSARVNGGVRSAMGSASERQAAQLLKLLKDMLSNKAGDYLYDLLVQEAAGALADAMNEELKDKSKAGRGGQARGSSAHKFLEKRLKDRMAATQKMLNRIDAELVTEVYYKKGAPAGRRNAPGSMGIDIAIYRPKYSAKNNAKPILLIDLKTGRGWGASERRNVSKAFGFKGNIVEIFVRKK